MAESAIDGTAKEPVKIDGRDIIVLYGSETGNAEDIAMELARITRRLHFKTIVDEMDNIKLTELIQCRLAIFVTSTTGQGDLPRNTEKFWKNLRRTKLNNTNCLGPLEFTIFGLGDSSYPSVNAAARKLRSRLKQLGASEFFKAGEGDEQHDNGIDSVYQPWSKELRDHLITNYPLPENIQPLSEDIILPPRYYIMEESMEAKASDPTSDEVEVERKFLETQTLPASLTHIERPRSSQEHMASNSSRLPMAIAARATPVWENENPRLMGSLDKDNLLTDHASKYLLKAPNAGTPELPPDDLLLIPKSILGTVFQNERVTPSSHWQDVRRLKITVQIDKHSDYPFLPYTAGATLVIYPKNYPEDVQTLINMMRWQSLADNPLSPQASSLPKKLYPLEGGKVTLRDMLIHNFDITAVPKRSFLREMAHFAKEENEKERLISLTKTSFQEEFYDYTSRPRRTILEVLRDFPSVRIPFIRAVEVFPLIRGREFSICTGAQHIGDYKDELIDLEILVALVEYKTIIRKPRQGLCSRYIKHLQPDTLIRVSINPPSSPTLIPRNMVVEHIGARQGRPVIAVATGTGIAPIRALIGDRLESKIRSPFLLFFGCRNKNADFFFEEEWNNNWLTRHVNLKVIPAFSRDENPCEVKPIDEKDEYGRVKPKAVDPLDATPKVLDFDSGKNYVQHQIRKHALEVGEILTGPVTPIICVCGNSGRMPAAVREAFEYVLLDQKVVPGEEEAKKWLNDKNKVIYWQETW